VAWPARLVSTQRSGSRIAWFEPPHSTSWLFQTVGPNPLAAGYMALGPSHRCLKFVKCGTPAAVSMPVPSGGLLQLFAADLVEQARRRAGAVDQRVDHRRICGQPQAEVW
jgi:hypothetical protein